MLIGHNPAIEDLAAALARGGERLETLRDKYPTAGLAGLDLDVASWADVAPGRAMLATFVVPRELD
jgi:phosphohistidine phosphatase